MVDVILNSQKIMAKKIDTSIDTQLSTSQFDPSGAITQETYTALQNQKIN
jgi:hypothetical protein